MGVHMNWNWMEASRRVARTSFQVRNDIFPAGSEKYGD